MVRLGAATPYDLSTYVYYLALAIQLNVDVGTLVLERILSGGQTGVDRAALDAALAAGIPTGGWCPRGRLAEDGRIPERYPLVETNSPNYAERTCLNVAHSDGTLVLNRATLRGGTRLTCMLAERLGRSLLVVDPETPGAMAKIQTWLAHEHIRVLNIAGPRESSQTGIYLDAWRLLVKLFNAPAHIQPNWRLPH